MKDDPTWHLLIHRIPARPLYLRARVRMLLARAGAVALKKAVYALPAGEGTLARLEAVAAEIRSGGGEAFLCEARFNDRRDAAALRESLREQRRLDYARLERTVSGLRRSLASPGARLESLEAGIAKARARFEAVAATDYFGAEGRVALERTLDDLRRRAAAPRRSRGAAEEWVGRVWVTRRGILVDRMACAWFIRRYLDEGARFRFAGPDDRGLKPGEIGFDMPGGAFSHERGGCSLETLIAKTGVRDPALEKIAEIVHELDLADGKFSVPETAGVGRLLAGLAASNPDDASRLERGLEFFDDLHRSLSQPPRVVAPRSLTRGPARRGR